MGRVINQFFYLDSGHVAAGGKFILKSPRVGSRELGEGQSASVYCKQASEPFLYDISTWIEFIEFEQSE
jgi:hypothetical protein